jgi:hypothetical protein
VDDLLVVSTSRLDVFCRSDSSSEHGSRPNWKYCRHSHYIFSYPCRSTSRGLIRAILYKLLKVKDNELSPYHDGFRVFYALYVIL